MLILILIIIIVLIPIIRNTNTSSNANTNTNSNILILIRKDVLLWRERAGGVSGEGGDSSFSTCSNLSGFYYFSKP